MGYMALSKNLIILIMPKVAAQSMRSPGFFP
jgi:hypothetical protein